ncbi:hypothetical protein GCM10023108_14140 [Saccharopolyspora hordei]|nr:hypothetical protein [Saccharopolyspora hordei]
MEPFDPEAYERDVVRPLRGRGGRLPDDLLTRYALALDFSDADLAQRLAQVRAHWRDRVRSAAWAGFTTSVYRAFLREDRHLRREHGDALARMSWWRARHEERAAAVSAQVAELAQVLGAHFGDLGLVTPGQLEALRRAVGPLAPREVDAALAEAGVRTVVPLDLPKTPGLPDGSFRRLKELLRDAEVTSVPALLHGELTGFALVTGFRSTPPRPDGLGADAVRAALERSGGAARDALELVSTAVDLRRLALYHLVDDVRRFRESGAPAGALLRVLRQSGLEEGEARHVVVSVLSEAGAPEVEATGLAKVTALLADGRLVAAQQALVGITDAEEAAAATAAVDRHAAQVRELREAARRALERGAEDDARRQLADAARLASDDGAIAAEARRIPVSPVADLTARSDGLGVRLSWRARPDHDAGTRYRVVRRAGRAPEHPGDGDVVAEGTATSAVDTAVPGGRTAGYAVFAAEPDGAWSRPAGATVEVLPPVHEVRLAVRDGAVEGRWEVHPDAVGVDVVRRGPSGEVPVPTDGLTAFRDTTVDTRADYLLVARYRLPDGTEARADAVTVRHTASSPPPVTSLDGRRSGRELLLSWEWPDGVQQAEVRWTRGAVGGRRRVTRQQYEDEGGCRVDAGPGAVDVRVTAVVGELRSSPAELTTGGPAQVGYRVVRRHRLFGATARILLHSDHPVPECELVVVVAPGRRMPREPGDGEVVHHAVHRIDGPVAVTVDLPRRGPFWLRCFASTSGVELIDPPNSQLEVP